MNWRFVVFRFLLSVMALASFLKAQEQRCDSPSWARAEKVDHETERVRCRAQSTCFDADSYIATVTDVFESSTPSSHLVRLIVRFENVSEAALILAYRAHSAFLLDDLGDRFFCCRTAEAPDASAVGIGIDTGDKVDPTFVLRPHESENVSFDLWRPLKPHLRASYYDFDLMIDEIDLSDSHAVRRHPFLSFRGLQPRVRPPSVKNAHAEKSGH